MQSYSSKKQQMNVQNIQLGLMNSNSHNGIGNRNVNCNNFVSTPQNKKPFQSRASLGYLNIHYLAPISNSVNHCSKKIIDYSLLSNGSNVIANMKPSQLTNRLSLFTIKEHMNINNNCNIKNNHRDNNDPGLKRTIASTSSKLFHIAKLPLPIQNSQCHLMHQSSNSNDKSNHNNSNSKPRKKYNYTPKRRPSYYANSNTNNNIESNVQTCTANKKTGIITRNNKLGYYSPKRFLSLNKDSNNRNGILDYDNKYPIYNHNNTNSHNSYRKIDNRKDSNNNSKRLKPPNQLQPSSNIPIYNKSNLALKTTLTNSNHDLSSSSSNIATIKKNIKQSQSKDIILSNKTPQIQNAFLLKLAQNHLREINSGNTLKKDKVAMTIKVNRKSSQNRILKKAFDNTTFIRLYSKYLTQNEIEELKQFKYKIYYQYPFNKRQKDNITYLNEITCSFSYKHSPNYTFVSHRRANSHKSLNEINSKDELCYSEYNDEEGNYALNHKDHLLYRYEIVQLLGTGSFGEAVKCIDHKTNEVVCVKIIKANPSLFTQAMTEIKILSHIKDNDTDSDNTSNIVRFISHFIFRGHICLVFEELDIDLYEYLKLNNYSGFEITKIRLYAIKLLFALLFLKRHKILHCDLKPENILLTKGDINNVKVIDFGSSCFEDRKMYTYIQSRFYRAPEIIMDSGYGVEIDMWSFGCIIAELYTGSPIFPGEDERDQLLYIIDYLGVPSISFINQSQKRELFFDKNNQPYSDKNHEEKESKDLKTKSISSFLMEASNEFVDFITQSLRWVPQDRIKPEEALLHQWVIGGMNAKELQLHKKKIEKYQVINSEGGNANSSVNRAKQCSNVDQTKAKTRNMSKCINTIIQGKRTKSKDSYCYVYNKKHN